MSHSHSHENTVPRPALWLVFGLVAASLALTSAVTLGLADREAVPSVHRDAAGVEQVNTRSLAFQDREDGSVLVTDADSGATVAVLQGEADGAGFVRGVMRGLARDRRMRGIGAAPPFELILWSDGAISLTDSATGREIELGGFGPDNRAAFAQFLERTSA